MCSFWATFIGGPQSTYTLLNTLGVFLHKFSNSKKLILVLLLNNNVSSYVFAKFAHDNKVLLGGGVPNPNTSYNLSAMSLPLSIYNPLAVTGDLASLHISPNRMSFIILIDSSIIDCSVLGINGLKMMPTASSTNIMFG